MSSRSGSSNNVGALILGGISLISLAGLCIYLYNDKKKTIDHSGFKEHKQNVNENEEVDQTKDSSAERDSVELKKIADEAALKESYDDALRLAKKLLLGNAFARAASKYTEAIEIASRIPSAKKDLTVLYNNRSAMYEKAGELEKSLLDITEVLALDVYHIKARTRRGRLYEMQGMQNEALNEYVAVIFADRKNGNNPSTIEKADEVCRSVAAKQTAVRLESIRAFAATNSAPLPTKSYCRKFFEALPSVHQWREKYRTTDRAELSNHWNSILGSRGADKKQEDVSPSTFIDLLTTALDLSRLDISNSLFVRAFGTINTALNLILVEKGVIVEDVKISAMLSILWQLKGVENLFRRDDTGCLAALQKSLKYDPNNLEANLVLCILHLELVQIKEAEDVITSCMSQINGAPVPAPVADFDGTESMVPVIVSSSNSNKLQTAWVMIQRSQIWVTRNEYGVFTQDSILGAMRDLDVAIALTAESTDEGSKRVRLAALLKTVYILLQLKIQTGGAPTEEDQDRVKACVIEAKGLFPKNEEVLMLEAEAAAAEGMFDDALTMMENVIKSADPTDSMPIIIQANILMQKALFSDQSGSQEAAMEIQRVLQDVEALYDKAICTEANALEAMVQCAQLLGMVGQVDKSLELSVKAVGYTRNREEMQVLTQLILFTQAQIRVSKEME